MTSKADEQQARADAHKAKAEEYRKTDAPSNQAAAAHHADKAAQAQTAANLYRSVEKKK